MTGYYVVTARSNTTVREEEFEPDQLGQTRHAA